MLDIWREIRKSNDLGFMGRLYNWERRGQSRNLVAPSNLARNFNSKKSGFYHAPSLNNDPLPKRPPTPSFAGDGLREKRILFCPVRGGHLSAWSLTRSASRRESHLAVLAVETGG